MVSSLRTLLVVIENTTTTDDAAVAVAMTFNLAFLCSFLWSFQMIKKRGGGN
jgi:hypothetical protein